MGDNTILYAIIALVVGAAIGYLIAKSLEKTKASKILQEAEKEAKAVIKEATVEGERIKNEKTLNAKEKFIELKSQHESEINNREKKNERCRETHT